jgi:hypothetical protein
MKTGNYKLTLRKKSDKKAKTIAKGNYYECLGYFHDLETCSYTHRKLFITDEYKIVKAK